jgi:predicted nucleic acid-binding protein
MHDIVLDTMILSEFLAQYFDHPDKNGYFKAIDPISPQMARIINSIIKSHKDIGINYIVASTFAFVEIARKFNEIADSRFDLEKFNAFVNEPPEWFIIQPVDTSLFLYLARIPAEVMMQDKNPKNIEWADAIHLATAMSRERCLLATTDSLIKQIEIFKSNII